MASTVTVTGKVGPGDTVTAQQFTGVTAFHVNTDIEVLQVDYTMLQGPKTTLIDISAAGTFTVTCSTTSNNYTVTIS